MDTIVGLWFLLHRYVLYINKKRLLLCSTKLTLKVRCDKTNTKNERRKKTKGVNRRCTPKEDRLQWPK